MTDVEWPGMLGKLRAEGWSVAVHNDYRVEGERCTFWLLTRGDYAIKGEGVNDAVALSQCLKEAARIEGKVSAMYDVYTLVTELVDVNASSIPPVEEIKKRLQDMKQDAQAPGGNA